MRVGDAAALLRGFVAGRRLREAIAAAGAGEDAGADDGGGGGALMLLSASLSPARGGAIMRTRARAGVSALAVVAAGGLDFLAVALVLRGPLPFCPMAPTPRAISAMPLSSVYREALPSSSSSSSSLSAKSPGGGRARLARTPPVLELARGPGPGSRARTLWQLSRKQDTSMSSAGDESARKRARLTSVCGRVESALFVPGRRVVRSSPCAFPRNTSRLVGLNRPHPRPSCHSSRIASRTRWCHDLYQRVRRRRCRRRAARGTTGPYSLFQCSRNGNGRSGGAGAA